MYIFKQKKILPILLLFISSSFFLQFTFCQPIDNKQQLIIQYINKDSSFNPQQLNLQTLFVDAIKCNQYINLIPSLLKSKGYVTASVDSVWQIENNTYINLYIGRKYKWIDINIDSIDKNAISQSGFLQNKFINKQIDFEQMNNLQFKILNYYENNGYPFAKIFLDKIKIDNDKISASLNINKGILYFIDSIRLYGNAKISKFFLWQYLGISNGSLFNKDKLSAVSQKIKDLPYIQESTKNTITMLGTGAVLNLYLAPKKSSQFNFLLGVLPSTNAASKFSLTADINLNLKNALGNGENILLNWQQLQPKSPKLNLGFQQPYIFHSKFGFDFSFDLFKKDSTYLQINALVGVQYLQTVNQWGKIFMQWQNSYLLANGVDTALIKLTKKLPENIDVSAANIGVDLEYIKTDYRLNPIKGSEISLIATTGIKKVKKNNDILSIIDPLFNYASLYDSIKPSSYQFKIKLNFAHFIKINKQSTIKLGINTGWYNSPSIFKNEMFLLGGYHLLRGFDEQSIYATRYVVSTVEYRYRMGLNSYLFSFVDGALVEKKYQNIDINNNFISTGLGMVFETKFGLLNLSYAIGKRDDVNFNIRQASKIHFGYVNYF